MLYVPVVSFEYLPQAFNALQKINEMKSLPGTREYKGKAEEEEN